MNNRLKEANNWLNSKASHQVLYYSILIMGSHIFFILFTLYLGTFHIPINSIFFCWIGEIIVFTTFASIHIYNNFRSIKLHHITNFILIALSFVMMGTFSILLQ